MGVVAYQSHVPASRTVTGSRATDVVQGVSTSTSGSPFRPVASLWTMRTTKPWTDTQILIWTSVSRLLGWTYTLAWSLSFYPQVIQNYQRSSTHGLSPDFVVLNTIGHTSYFAFNSMFLFFKPVRKEFREKYGREENLVRFNDWAFSAHATLLAFITFLQWLYYDRDSQTLNPETEPLLESEQGHLRQPSSSASASTAHPTSHRNTGRSTDNTITTTTTSSKAATTLSPVLRRFVLPLLLTAFVILVGAKQVGLIPSWLVITSMLSNLKLAITITKYIPQIRLNQKRKSTKGFHIQNILLDLTGGILSLLQLFLDAAIQQAHTDIHPNSCIVHNINTAGARIGASNFTDIWQTVTQDPAKLGLSLLTLFFDTLLILQHYVLFGPVETSDEQDGAIPEHQHDDDEYEQGPGQSHQQTGRSPSQVQVGKRRLEPSSRSTAQPSESTPLLR